MGVQQKFTDDELRQEYHKMISIMASGKPDWRNDLESHILQKGRTEMHHLIAYLFTKCILLSSDNIELQKQLELCAKALNKEVLDVGREEAVPDSMES